MRKFSNLILLVALFGLTACHDSHRGIDYIYDGYGYYGDDLAGRSYEVSFVELGINSGDFIEVDNESLTINFGVLGGFVTGNKNCNSYTSDVNWYEFGVALDFYFTENYLCSPEVGEFPEGIYLDDAFEIDITYDGGRQILVLYSEAQDVSIYLYEQ